MSDDVFVIVDRDSGELFQRRPCKTGWYGAEKFGARFYKSKKAAVKTIVANGHHVSYPGNRRLTVKNFNDI